MRKCKEAVKIKVLVADAIADLGVEQLQSAGLEVVVKTKQSPEELVKEIKDYDAIIVRSAAKVTKDVIEAGEKLKIIGRAGIGLDNVDMKAATARGIMVANAPEGNIISAAEHTIALLMSQARRIPQANVCLKNGDWNRKLKGVELYDKVLGVIGLGRVGALVAARGKGFEMQVIAFDPYVSGERFQELGIRMVESLDELLKQADFITIHLPLTDTTKGLIGKKEIDLMKDGVRIINTARGGIIDEDALAQAIEDGKVAGAALDVFSREPCTSSRLFGFEQVVVTPHLGAATVEAQDRAGVIIAQQVIAALRGDFVSNAVNIAAASVEEAVKPYLPLAEKLGRLLTHISSTPMSTIEIEYAGKIANYDISILTVAALKGLFANIVHEPVTFVNAPLLAKERGLDVKEVKTKTTKDYISTITLVGKDTGQGISAGGTLVGKNNQERFINIYDFDIDMVPSEYMAFFQYVDKPGMIGKVGTILGANGINIANMQVGRKVVGGDALMGINVDMPISDEIMENIKEQAGIEKGTFIVL